MARPATSPAARLRAITAAKARAAKLKRGDTLTAQPMAELLKVSWPVLRDWCSDIPELVESGAVSPGGNGIEWTFKPGKTITVLEKHFKAVLDGQAKESRRITKAVGVTLPDAEMAPSLGDTKDLVNLTLSVVAATEKQNLYILAEEVVSFIAAYNQRILDGIMGVRTRSDPNGNLPVAVRTAVDGYLRQVATDVHAEAARFIEDHRAAIGKAGTRGAS